MCTKEDVIKIEAQHAAPLFLLQFSIVNSPLSILFIDSFPWQRLVEVGYP